MPHKSIVASACLLQLLGAHSRIRGRGDELAPRREPAFPGRAGDRHGDAPGRAEHRHRRAHRRRDGLARRARVLRRGTGRHAQPLRLPEQRERQGHGLRQPQFQAALVRRARRLAQPPLPFAGRQAHLRPALHAALDGRAERGGRQHRAVVARHHRQPRDRDLRGRHAPLCRQHGDRRDLRLRHRDRQGRHGDGRRRIRAADRSRRAARAPLLPALAPAWLRGAAHRGRLLREARRAAGARQAGRPGGRQSGRAAGEPRGRAAPGPTPTTTVSR